MKKKSRLLIYLLTIIGVITFLNNSCKKDDNNKTTVAVLTTTSVTDITLTTASCGGNITLDGGSAITTRGVCWSIDVMPTTSDYKTTDGTGTGSFTSAITGLSPNTTYYVRAYATNLSGIGYGSVVSFTTLQAITDIDGNIYDTVRIGTQVWLKQNLKATHYRNGDPIPNVTDGTAWSNLTTGAYCDYENSADSSTIYGKLYNFFTVVDSRNLCPIGWHVPTDAEWTILTTYLGGESVAGNKMKSTSGWGIFGNGSNECGFTALPGGYRFGNGIYADILSSGYWWSSTPSLATNAWYRSILNDFIDISRSDYGKKFGFSVRCIKD